MKTVLVTGGREGLGKGFVEYLLDQNYLVFAGVRDVTKATENLSHHQNLRIIPLDVTDDTSIADAVGNISQETDHLDLLINNAGVNKDTATNNHKELVCELPRLDRRILQQMFDINTISPLIVVQKCLPLLEKAQNSFVINISSDRASYHDETPNASANYGYRASKTALNMMTFCSVIDLPAQVKTFAVHPGSVKTHMNPHGRDLPYNQAKQIVSITTHWKDDFNGKYLRYDGTFYPL